MNFYEHIECVEWVLILVYIIALCICVCFISMHLCLCSWGLDFSVMIDIETVKSRPLSLRVEGKGRDKHTFWYSSVMKSINVRWLKNCNRPRHQCQTYQYPFNPKTEHFPWKIWVWPSFKKCFCLCVSGEERVSWRQSRMHLVIFFSEEINQCQMT